MRSDTLNTSNPEADLWAKILQNDEKAFRQLFELFYPPLCLYARRYIDDRDTREDMVQEVFAVLWEDRQKMRINTSIRNYLIVCVKNQCISYFRREEYMQQYVDYQVIHNLELSAYTDEIYLQTELQQLLEKALSKLPEVYRVVFEMNRLEGKSFEEIAEALNISVRTAKRYKSKTTDILKEELKDYLPFILSAYPLFFD